uniref:Uncharacterized protein n=2 Tax=unclassified Crassvirales TaxID=2949298 RepID=A0AAU8MJB2_9CAUD
MKIIMVKSKSKSDILEKIRRMREDIETVEEMLDSCEDIETQYNRGYDDYPRSRERYDDERYHEREEHGHRERGRYGRY